MKTQEDRIRSDIQRKYGSIPKMAAATGIPQNTIYHALERGMDNTTTTTRRAILESLYGMPEYVYAQVELPADEAELLDIFRALDARDRAVLLSTARALAGK